MVDTHILVQGLAANREKLQVRKTNVPFKDNSPDLKADFPKHVKTLMKSTFHKYVVNVTPITNPKPMSKSEK